jgi:hypothetical protein
VGNRFLYENKLIGVGLDYILMPYHIRVVVYNASKESVTTGYMINDYHSTLRYFQFQAKDFTI